MSARTIREEGMNARISEGVWGARIIREVGGSARIIRERGMSDRIRRDEVISAITTRKVE